MKRLSLLWLLSLFPACTCGVNVDAQKYFCSNDVDCGEGMVCRKSECIRLDAGAGDGGVGGGGGDGGTLPCRVDGGVTQLNESVCGDNRDNDCDGLVDCADLQCSTLPCGPNGRVCSEASCTCSGNGGVGQPTETTCGDMRDNDCDGLVDCDDPHCNTLSCGATGRTCVSMVCVCSGNGGTAQVFESQCFDGSDNDCDTLIDCADPTCEGRSCGAGCTCQGTIKAELSCSGGIDDDNDGQADCADTDCAARSCGTGCVCSGGVRVETACSNSTDDDGDATTDCADSNCCVGCSFTCEQTCNDGLDDDTNQLTDCADPRCSGRACGANGRVCNGATCSCSGNGGIHQAAETACFDGFDNDCDGLVDCADPSCQAQPCTCEVNCRDGIDNDCNGSIDCADAKCLLKSCSATAAASVCCSTGTTGNPCKDLGSDDKNCGGCGLSCASSRNCVAVTSGAISSGRCECSNSGMCPNGQSCSSGCQCDMASKCASNQSCTSQLCHY